MKSSSCKCCFDYVVEDDKYSKKINNAAGEYVKTLKNSKEVKDVEADNSEGDNVDGDY